MADFGGVPGAAGCAVSAGPSLGGVLAFGSVVVGSGVSGVDRQAFRDNADKTHSNSAKNAPGVESVCVRLPVIGNQPNSFSAIFVPCAALRALLNPGQNLALERIWRSRERKSCCPARAAPHKIRRIGHGLFNLPSCSASCPAV